MSGSVLTVGLVVGTVTLTSLALPLYMGLVTRQAVSAAADAAALAAADTASGLVGGIPCDSAARVAAANGAGLSECTVDGLVVTVTVQRPIVGIAVSATATAGPPASGVD